MENKLLYFHIHTYVDELCIFCENIYFILKCLAHQNDRILPVKEGFTQECTVYSVHIYATSDDLCRSDKYLYRDII